MTYYVVMHGSTKLDEVMFDLCELIFENTKVLLPSLEEAKNWVKEYESLEDGEPWQIFKITIEKV